MVMPITTSAPSSRQVFTGTRNGAPASTICLPSRSTGGNTPGTAALAYTPSMRSPVRKTSFSPLIRSTPTAAKGSARSAKSRARSMVRRGRRRCSASVRLAAAMVLTWR